MKKGCRADISYLLFLDPFPTLCTFSVIKALVFKKLGVSIRIVPH